MLAVLAPAVIQRKVRNRLGTARITVVWQRAKPLRSPHGSLPSSPRAGAARAQARHARTRLHDLELEVVVGGEVRQRHAREPLRRRRADVRHKDERLA